MYGIKISKPEHPLMDTLILRWGTHHCVWRIPLTEVI